MRSEGTKVESPSVRDRYIALRKKGPKIRAKEELAWHRAALDRAATGRAAAVRYGREFDQLLTHPEIHQMDIRGKRMIVTTKPIVLPHRGAQYDIGRFRITILAGGWSSDIRIVNLTRTVRGYHHPQGFTRRYVCFGDMESDVDTLLAEGKYAVLINLCIHFLQNWGNNPAVRSCDWPTVRKGRRS